MNYVDVVVENIYEYFVYNGVHGRNIIRVHTKMLNDLGDLSFPLNIKNWYHLIDKQKLGNKEFKNIFEYRYPEQKVDRVLGDFVKNSKTWLIPLTKWILLKDNIHIFLDRIPCIKLIILECLRAKENYGFLSILENTISINVANSKHQNLSVINLTELRMLLLMKVMKNFINKNKINSVTGCNKDLTITSTSNVKSVNNVICGPVLNERGIKDVKVTAEELYNKRSMDMRLMAQHRYGVQVKPLDSWNEYFSKLGKGAVNIELLQHKPHKEIKVSLNDLSSSHKGAAFIFYNCARLAALFREFQKRVDNNIYPKLPPATDVDFSLLNQPEEWELFYVYIMKFPSLIKSCIKDVEVGIINPHYLITFLSSLCALFSTYYRRVRILIDPREHLFAVLHARIYLLQALEQIFHNTLAVLDVQPVKKM